MYNLKGSPCDPHDSTKKIKITDVNKYKKVIPLKINFIRLCFNFLLIKILEIKPLNSTHEIAKIIIRNIIIKKDEITIDIKIENKMIEVKILLIKLSLIIFYQNFF